LDADARDMLNGSTIALKQFGSAHTESDISVTFAEANVVHLADTFPRGVKAEPNTPRGVTVRAPFGTS
jgi:hypothetical protein